MPLLDEHGRLIPPPDPGEVASTSATTAVPEPDGYRMADYRAPVPGLYLCGSGTHPGGGVTGAPGHNAAREMIRDLR